MIFSFCRNVTAKIVVPRPNTVNVFCGKTPKICASVANGSHPSTDQGGGKRRAIRSPRRRGRRRCKRWLVPAVWSSERHLEQEKYCYDYNDSQYHRQWLVKDRHIKRPL